MPRVHKNYHKRKRKRRLNQHGKLLFAVLGFLLVAVLVLVVKGQVLPAQKAKTALTQSDTASQKLNKSPESSSTSQMQASSSSTSQELSLQAAVGELFLVGTDSTSAPSQDVVTDIKDYGTRNFILTHTSDAGVSGIRAIVEDLYALTGSQQILVSADQEGGEVQHLKGAGFDVMPSALLQGQEDTTTLQENAKIWGEELKAAGVNWDLAPVADTVPSASFAPENSPIGYWQREFGYDTATILPHAEAFFTGMESAGVMTSAKHFPGLGYVTENTDFSAGVTDTMTTATSPSVALFTQLMADKIPAIMTSTAIYSQIDPNTPAAFSSKIVTGIIRDGAHYTGIIVTDSLDGTQVQGYSLEERALDAISAGNDMICLGSPNELPAMYEAVLSKAQTDSSFAQQVQQSASRIIAAQQKYS